MVGRDVCLVAVSFLAISCAVAPTVEYTKIASSSDVKGDEIDTFALQQSQIVIDKNGTKKDTAGKEIDDFSITSVPAEFPDFKVGIRKHDSWGIHTNLNLTKIENTALVKEVGVEVVDERAELIGKYGAIVTKIIGLVGFTAGGDLPDSSLPKTINVTVLLGNVGRDAAAGVDAADGVTLDIGKAPVDAMDASGFSYPHVMSGIMYSACRTARVKFKYKGHDYSRDVVISDPRYFQQVAFPLKGKVSFHSQCGVSVTANKDTGVSSDAAIVDALLAQGKSIKDAIDAAKKPSK